MINMAGHVFFAWEILPLLEVVRDISWKKVKELLDYESAPDKAMWVNTYQESLALVKRMNELSNQGDETLYKQGNYRWNQVEALAKTASQVEPNIQHLVDELPQGGKTVDWKVWAALGVGGAALLTFILVKKGVRLTPRRKRNPRQRRKRNPRQRRYPRLTRRQRKRASRYIAEEMRTGKYPRKQAIRIGLERARRAA